MVYKGKKKTLEDAEKRKNMIVEWLKENKIQTWIQLYRHIVEDKKVMSKTTLCEHLKELSTGTIKTIEKEKLGNSVYYFLPENRREYEKVEKECLKRRKPIIKEVAKEVVNVVSDKKDIPLPRIEKHTEDIQEQLLKPWIKIASRLLNYHLMFGKFSLSYNPCVKLFDNTMKEGDILHYLSELPFFNDFREKHIPEEKLGNPYKLLEKYFHLRRCWAEGTNNVTKEGLIKTLKEMIDILSKYLRIRRPLHGDCEYIL